MSKSGVSNDSLEFQLVLWVVLHNTGGEGTDVRGPGQLPTLRKSTAERTNTKARNVKKSETLHNVGMLRRFKEQDRSLMAQLGRKSGICTFTCNAPQSHNFLSGMLVDIDPEYRIVPKSRGDVHHHFKSDTRHPTSFAFSGYFFNGLAAGSPNETLVLESPLWRVFTHLRVKEKFDTKIS